MREGKGPGGKGMGGKGMGGAGNRPATGRTGRDEGDLAPFFAAARAARPMPDPRLLASVLADAAAKAQPPHRRRWPAAAALAASVAAGFLVGVSGVASLGDGPLGDRSSLAADAAFATVGAVDSDAAGFFDLAWEG